MTETKHKLWATNAASIIIHEYGKVLTMQHEYLVAVGNIATVIENHYPEDKATTLLLEACKEFVRKVECGEARSRRSYTQMKAAIAEYEGTKE